MHAFLGPFFRAAVMLNAEIPSEKLVHLGV